MKTIIIDSKFDNRDYNSYCLFHNHVDTVSLIGAYKDLKSAIYTAIKQGKPIKIIELKVGVYQGFYYYPIASDPKNYDCVWNIKYNKRIGPNTTAENIMANILKYTSKS